ncbi:helix-turn-helix domain-containing protein [Stigmatella ashevillensis]|uniref:helix-turn-helix domain-containing protein n=1 Tax=Stigmatella ashevillensis TaxID=2995309 RepID=UPI00358DB5CA
MGQGQSTRRIAQALRLTERTVYNCRRRWRQFGLRGLAPAAQHIGLRAPNKSKRRDDPPEEARGDPRGAILKPDFCYEL